MAAQLNTSLMTVAVISLLVPAAFVSGLGSTWPQDIILTPRRVARVSGRPLGE